VPGDVFGGIVRDGHRKLAHRQDADHLLARQQELDVDVVPVQLELHISGARETAFIATA
jgi:hypothetical protein